MVPKKRPVNIGFTKRSIWSCDPCASSRFELPIVRKDRRRPSSSNPAAFRTDFVSLLAGPKAKVEKLPSVGSFSEIYSFTDGDYDQVVVFQGDFIIELLARAAINRIPSKGFAVLLLTRIDATQVTTSTVASSTVTTPTVTTPTVPVSPATSTAVTTATTTLPATGVVPITTRSPSAV